MAGQCIRRSTGRLLTVIVLCAWLGGCTLARFGYEMLPWYGGWQFDRYLSLDDTQRQLVSQRLEALHAWHRQTQLPRYAQLVDTGLANLGERVAAERIAQWRASMVSLWEEPALRLAPDMADLALTLKPAQLDRLERRLTDATVELRRKYLDTTPSRRIDARVERWQERMQWLLGDLTANQQRELKRLAREQPSDEAAWLDERQARNDKLLKLLRRIERERPSREQALAWCTEFLQGFWRSDDPERARRLEANAANGDRLSATMLNTANGAQREHLNAKLRDVESDFLRMIGRAN
jgi:hypothetical protein